VQTVLDYFEGWFEGDAARMERALHRDLAKRRSGEELGITTKRHMVELTESGEGKQDAADGRIDPFGARLVGGDYLGASRMATSSRYVTAVAGRS